MEVVLNSEIARLVLGYLRDQKLHVVSAKFCKHSPYLCEENEIIKKGLLPVSIKDDGLVQIIREYCHINSKITKTVETFPSNVREAFNKQNLLGKITYLLKLAKRNLNSNSNISTNNIIDNTTINNKSNDINNITNNDNIKNKKIKRRRSQILSDTSTSSIETTQVKDLPGYCPSSTKKRRISNSYCFIQDAHSASSGDSSIDDNNYDDILPNTEISTNTTTNVINQNESNIQQEQPSTIFTLDSSNNEPPVIIDTPKPKSSIIFKPTNQINNNNLSSLQISGQQTPILNSNEQNNNSNNSICTTTSSSTSLIDPNYSISKLIIMNSNDITQQTAQDTIFNTNTGLSPFAAGEQVFIDLGTGQTFPFIMTNDGMNCMFINRSDIESNNYQSVLLTNNTTTTTPTTTTNEIIDESTKNQQNTLNKSTIIDKQHVPQSLDSKLIKENATPDNIIINQPIVRSLSTPRRKSSHVRVLNFSPLTTKITEILNQQQQIEQQQNIKEKKQSSNQPIIESVQILPQLQKPFIQVFTEPGTTQSNEIETESVATTVTQSTTVDNECSNSNSTDLTGGEHSNVTVIQRINIDTPRRKTNLRSCKRVLSQSNSDDGNASNIKNRKAINRNNKKKLSPRKKKLSPKRNCLRKRKKPSIENEEKNTEKMIADEIEADPMEAWRQMRLKTKSTNFDQHLREVASKTPTVGHFRNHSKRRKRRKIGGNVTRDDDNIYHTDINDDDSPDTDNTKIDNNKLDDDDIVTTKHMTTKRGSKTLLNFKIKTPIKLDTITNKKQQCDGNGKENSKMNKTKTTPIHKKVMSKKEISEIEKNQEIIVEENDIVENLNNNNIVDDVPKNIDNTLMTTTITDQHQQPLKSYVVPSTIMKERAKRTANIAHLLETPFKVESILFPITPKFIEPQINDTPATKLSQLSTFSSLKHLDIRTPAFAITPGSCLTPADKETPKSGCLSSIQTDYSSGGSYYRPDESEDLDKQLDRNLNDEMRKRRIKNFTGNNKPNKTNPPSTIKISKESEKLNENDNKKETNSEKTDDKNVKTPEIIVPCPVVLEKVKSFSDDKPNIIPHYKFSDALPELTDESTTSSSSSSSSQSSVSSKSSSSSSSSASSTDKSHKSKKSLFSVIDSSEDEEWDVQSKEKMNKIIDEENSQLVTNDGEVRFPVRSWITPKKTDDKLLTTPKKLTSTITKIPNNSMMPIYDEKSKQQSDLEQKRQRIKQQLAEDFKNSNKQYKKLSPTKRTPTSKFTKYDNKNEKKLATTKSEKTMEEKNLENRHKQMEVLTALNLSARKKPIDEEQSQKNQQQQHHSNILPNLDDNATSDIFNNNNNNNQMDDEKSQYSSSGESLKIRNAALALTTLSMQQKKKLTLPIEPLPMIKKMRGRPKRIQNNDKLDNKIQLIKKEPIKELTIKLRRETRLSPMLLKEYNKKLYTKKLTSDCTKKSEKISDSINKPKLNDDKFKSNKLEKDNNKLKKDINELESLNEVKSKSNKIEKLNIKSKQEINQPQPSTSKCTKSYHMSPIQSSEIRSSVEETELPAKLKTNLPILSKSCIISNEEIVQVSSASDPSTNNLNQNIKVNEEKNNVAIDCKINNDNDTNSNTDDFEDEEDPYECCELMKSNHFPTKTFIYSGPNDYYPEYIKDQYDFKNSTMNINLNGICHKLQCTNEIVLFSMKPKLLKLNNDIKKDSNNKRIKSIPKKRERNIKIISIDKSPDLFPSDKEESLQSINTTSSHLPKFKICHKNRYSDNNLAQSSTSNELTKSLENKHNLPSTSSESRNSDSKTDDVSSSVSVPATIPAITTKSSKTGAKTTTIVDNQETLGKNIRAEDISAVLSHLHGSEDQ